MRKHRRKRLYISGAIRADTYWGRELNIRRAEDVAIELVRMGYNVHCPHSLARFAGDAIDEDHWITLDLEMLEVFDGIVMVGNWTESVGAVKEHTRSKDLGLAVAYWPRDAWKLRAWREGKPWDLLKQQEIN